MKQWLICFIFFWPVSVYAQISYAYGTLIINEIMADPVGLNELPAIEYIEIYNTTGQSVRLKNWSFIYIINESSNRISILPDTVLPPNGYAVLFHTEHDIHFDGAGIELPVPDFPSNLANTGKLLHLRDSSGILIDSVTYAKAKSAQSWERDANDEWYLSTDPRGGTPGTVNSPMELPDPPPVVNPEDHSVPGDIIINEVMANPVGLTELPETEYVEIFNASGSDIPLYGWTFVYDGKSYTLSDTTLSAGQYALLFRKGRDMLIDSGVIDLSSVSFPANLANTGKEIQLRNSKDTIIDAVVYSTAKPARSWEHGANGEWYLSTDPRGGTPGTVNSPMELPDPPPVVNPEDHSVPGDIIINEVMANPVGLTELPETEYVEIFNASGSDLPLYGWTFMYDGRSYVLSDTILSAGQYALLFRKGKDMLIDSEVIDLSSVSFPANLANTGKEVQLRNSKDTIIDAVVYSTAKPARSWERGANGEWYLSTDPRGGTPGMVNSPMELPDPPPVVNPEDHSVPGDIIINEVMANPVGLTELPETEYVEIFNASGSDLPLYGWTFMYDGRSYVLSDTILSAGQYALLFRKGRDMLIDSGVIDLSSVSFPANLANTGKEVQLRNSKDTIIDAVVYSTAKPARSWEHGANGEWYLSTDPRGGTPGMVNSPMELPDPPPVVNPEDHSVPGDIIINEIMANPAGLTELPETEYIEIYNTTDTTVFIKNWSFVYGEKAIRLPDTVLSAKRYAVIYRSGRDILIQDTGLALPIENFPARLANAGEKLYIMNSQGVVIDSVNYLLTEESRSWERDSTGKWYLSNDPKGGTPGTINSQQHVEKPPPNNPGITDSTKYHDLIINEIMANPVGLIQLPETEYVEIYNMSEITVSLKNWSFIYDNRKISLPDTIIAGNQYVVLYKTGRDIRVDSTGFALPASDFPVSLANAGKTLQLRNAHDLIIDSVSYASAKFALSWERDSEGLWYLSNDIRGGTPGSANSPKEIVKPPVDPGIPTDSILSVPFIVEEKELIFNELLPEPFTGGSEYIELYNRSNRTLSFHNLSIAVRKADGMLSTYYSLKNISDSIYPNEYIVLTTNRNEVLDFYYTHVPEAIYEIRVPVLNNTGATLVLLRTHDKFIIDQVDYSSKWHDIAIKNMKGVSLERIHPDIDTQNVENWSSATAMVGYGTPGYKNSQFGNIAGNEQGVFLNAPEYQPEFNEYSIIYETDQPGYRCRMEVFSIEGRKVAEIMNNQLIGTSGEIRWNGVGSDGSQLRSGIYIFYGELYHPTGQKRIYKKALLIR